MDKTNNINQIYNFDNKIEDVSKELLRYEAFIHYNDEFIFPNLMIDKENGKALGFEISNEFTNDDFYNLLSIGKERFMDLYYIEPLWKEFSKVIVNDKFEENGDITLAEDFHIWKTGTKIDDIKEWFSENYITFDFNKLQEKYPLDFTDKNDVVYTFENEGTSLKKSIKEIVNRAIKKAKEFNKKIEKKRR
ncbi:MAG: hypothetical protein NSGCLCUN01_02233 [uncultured Clostridium sp.]